MTLEEAKKIIAKDGFANYLVVKSESKTPKYPSWSPKPCQSVVFVEAVSYLCKCGYEVLRDSEIDEYNKKHDIMTLEEAKKILEKEFAVIGIHKSTEPFEFDESGWIEHEKPSVLEAFRVLSKEGYYITISGHDYNMRTKRLEKEYEKNTKAPGSGEEQPKEGDLKAATKMFGAQAREIMRLTAENAELRETIDKMKEGNPALKESASQFNAALLDEQAKKIAELTKENVRLERVSKTTTDEFNKLYYRMITKSDKIEALGKEIARLNKIIHKKNLKIDELGKESSRHLEGKIKLFGENLDLEQMLKDKNAVLSDVAEELRLSKIREKNLTEVCQKYIKANGELKEKLANKVVDNINANALKSAESALAWKEKVIENLGKELAETKKYQQKAYLSCAEKNEEIRALKLQISAWEKRGNGIDWKRNAEAIKLYVNRASRERLWNTVNQDICNEKELSFIINHGGKRMKYALRFDGTDIVYECSDPNKKPSFFRDDSVGAVTNQKDCSPAKDTHSAVDVAEEGADHSGVIVLRGKDFVDAIKKMK